VLARGADRRDDHDHQRGRVRCGRQHPDPQSGESAILAFGQIRDLPWVVDGQIAVRKVTTLALSFDHRIIDGELGSYLLRDVGAMLEDPLRMLAWA